MNLATKSAMKAVEKDYIHYLLYHQIRKKKVKKEVPEKPEILSALREKVEKYKKIGFEYSDLRVVYQHLQIETGFQCPVLWDSIKNIKDGVYYLLAIYDSYDPLKILKPVTMTPEQQAIIDSTEKYVVVNAGPGTGKTMTGVARAIKLFSQGEYVLMFGYSVKCVYEIYTRVLKFCNKKFVDFKGTKNKELFDDSIKIYVSTIDSFVSRFICMISPFNFRYYSQHQTGDYEENIKRFLELDQSKIHIPSRYHVIIDEAQDISEDRFRCLERLFCYFKSVYVFGDPRQRIRDECGMEFKKMFGNPGFNRKPLTITHRFKNKTILDFCNFYSSLREDIHVPLVSAHALSYQAKIKLYNIGKMNTTGYIFKFVEEVLRKYRDQNKTIAIITPTLWNESRSTQNIREIFYIIRNCGISVVKSNQVEDFYENKSVLVTTIDSAKGMEFDVVFVYGLETIHYLTPLMSEDVFQSKMFVAFSRAKEELGILVHDDKYPLTIVPHQSLPKEVLDFFEPYEFGGKLVNLPKIEIRRYVGIKNLLNYTGVPEKLEKFLKYNGICYGQGELKTEQIKKEDIPVDEDPENIGEFVGLVIECHLKNDFPVILKEFADSKTVHVPYEKYQEYRRLRNGKYYVIEGEPSFVTEEEKQKVKNILKKKVSDVCVDEWILLIDVMNHVQSETGFRYRYKKRSDDLKRIREVAEILKRSYHDVLDIEKYCYMNSLREVVGYSDMLCKRFVIEIKYVEKLELKHIYQTIFYMITLERSCGHLIDLKNGRILTLKIDLEKWRLMFESFLLILDTDYFLNLSGCNKRLTGYVVDTEFQMYTGEIFERAIVNLSDPYDTLIEVRKISRNDDIIWFSQHHHWDGNSALRLFFNSRGSLKPFKTTECVYYYFSPRDIQGIECDRKINVAEPLKNYVLKLGSSLKRSFKLGDIFKIIFGDEEEFRFEHTALGDCLALYAIFKKIGTEF